MKLKAFRIASNTGCSSSSSSSFSGIEDVVERIQHGYDLAGNRLWRRELADPTETHDEQYFLDGVYRIKDLRRGTLNSEETAITTSTFAQCWGLDAAGNWQSFRQDDTGSGVWDLAQTRVYNTVNEIINIIPNTGQTWATPSYDFVGNMSVIPQPTTPIQSIAATYDAWNRLMILSAASSPIASYQYDGMEFPTKSGHWVKSFWVTATSCIYPPADLLNILNKRSLHDIELVNCSRNRNEQLGFIALMPIRCSE